MYSLLRNDIYTELIATLFNIVLADVIRYLF